MQWLHCMYFMSRSGTAQHVSGGCRWPAGRTLRTPGLNRRAKPLSPAGNAQQLSYFENKDKRKLAQRGQIPGGRAAMELLDYRS